MVFSNLREGCFEAIDFLVGLYDVVEIFAYDEDAMVNFIDFEDLRGQTE